MNPKTIQRIDYALGFIVRLFGRLVVGAIFLVAIAYIGLLAWTQAQCGHCSGPGGYIWIVAFFAAPVGVPAVLFSVVYLVVRSFWHSRKR